MYREERCCEEADPHLSLRESHERHNRLRTVIEHSREWFWETDAEGVFTYVSSHVRGILGYEPADLLGTRVCDFMTDDGISGDAPPLESLIAAGQPIRNALAIHRHHDGHPVYLETNGLPWTDDHRNRCGYTGMSRDITERKHLEALLQTTESKLSAALEMAHLGYWEYDVARDLFTFNDHFYSMLHTTVEEVGGYTMSPDLYAQRFVHPEDAPLVRAGIQKALETADTRHCGLVDHRIVYADGGTGYINVRAFVVKDAEGRTIRTYGVNQDITDRKGSEEALTKERELLRLILETIPDEVCLKDLDHRFVLANSACVHALGGRDMGDLLGRTDLDVVPSVLAREHLAEEEDLLTSGRPIINKERAERDPATGMITRCLLTTKVPVRDAAGTTTGILVVNRNIAERKRAEEALLRSEERYRTMFETTGAASILVDQDGTLRLVNKEFEHLSGYAKEEIEGLVKWPAFVCDSDRERMLEYHRLRMQGSKDLPTKYEFGFVARNNTPRRIFMTINLIPETTDCVASLADITDQKLTADLLAQQSREMEAIVRSLDDLVFEVDEHGTYLNAWTSDESLLALPRSEIIGRTIPDVVGDTGKWIVEVINRVLTTGRRESIEYPLDIHGDKRWFVASVNRVAVGNEGRRTASVLVRDVTGRKRMELELRRVEEQYRNIVEAAQDVIFGLSSEGMLVHANAAFTALTGWSVEDWADRPFIEILRPEDRQSAQELLAQALEHGMSGSREGHVITKSGNDLLVDVTWAPQYSDGRVTRVLGIARDITERKLTETKMRLLLRDKESLVHEIQHRVGNSLQMISSLLSFEMTRLHAADDAKIFRQMQNRIKAMAVVHDAVINAGRHSHLDFSASIRKLCDYLVRHYGKSGVEVEFLLDEGHLALEQAVPAALIIYELLSNALRHAYPEGRGGRIAIACRRLHEEDFALSVADDGVGYQHVPLTDGARSTLGLKLVSILVDQIGGSLMTENENGTKHTIVFPRRLTER